MYLDKNLVQYEIDFTSVEYISKSDASSFTFGTHPNIFNVIKKGLIEKFRGERFHLVFNNSDMDTSFHQAGLVNFSPIHMQQANCMWDLIRCSTGNDKRHSRRILF